MKLHQAAGRNFMGGTFSVTLGPLNIIYGRNDAGKTRLGNLIKLLLVGHLPTLDKKPRAIFDALSSGKEMGITGEFDGGLGIYRSWTEKGSSIKVEAGVPPEFDGKTPLVLLDANDYFSRSARGRVEMVFAVADISDKIVDFPPEIAATLRSCEAGARAQAATTMQELIDVALEGVEDARKRNAEDVRRYTGTLQGLTQLQLNDKPAARSVAEIDIEIEAERQQAANKRAKKSTLEEEQRKAEAIGLHRDDLQHKIERAGDPTIRDIDITALRAREGPLNAKLANLYARKGEHEEWQRREDYRKSQIAAVEADIARLSQEAEKAERQPAAKKCPTCGQTWTKGATFHPNRNIIASKQASLAELQRSERPEPKEKPDQSQIDVLESELQQVRDDIAEYVQTAEVKAWQKQLAETPTPPDHSAEIAQLSTEIEAHHNKAQGLVDERRLAESDRQDRKRLAEAQEAQEKAIAAETRYKDAKKFLLEKKATLIEQVFGPLLDTAERFTRGIFPHRVEYRDGELGAFNGGQWVTEAAFGGAKRALLYAALQCTLGAQSPCRIILMDEMLNLVTHLKQFLVNVAEAQRAGTIEQFIGLIPTGDLFPVERLPVVPGFQIIEATGKGYEHRG